MNSFSNAPKFIITGLPRSGTTWLSNLLMANNLICLHDPIGYSITPDELFDYEIIDESFINYPFGISCTSAWMFKDIILDVAIKKGIPIIFITRELSEINNSLTQLKLPIITNEEYAKFESVLEIEDKNLNVHIFKFSDLFNVDNKISMKTIKSIWNICSSSRFNSKRAELLKEMEIQPLFNSLVPDTSKFLRTIELLKKEIK